MKQKLVITMPNRNLGPDQLERFKQKISEELGGVDVTILIGVTSAVVIEVPE